MNLLLCDVRCQYNSSFRVRLSFTDESTMNIALVRCPHWTITRHGPVRGFVWSNRHGIFRTRGINDTGVVHSDLNFV